MGGDGGHYLIASGNGNHNFRTYRALLDGFHGTCNLVSCTDFHGSHRWLLYTFHLVNITAKENRGNSLIRRIFPPLIIPVYDYQCVYVVMTTSVHVVLLVHVCQRDITYIGAPHYNLFLLTLTRNQIKWFIINYTHPRQKGMIITAKTMG